MAFDAERNRSRYSARASSFSGCDAILPVFQTLLPVLRAAPASLSATLRQTVAQVSAQHVSLVFATPPDLPADLAFPIIAHSFIYGYLVPPPITQGETDALITAIAQSCSQVIEAVEQHCYHRFWREHPLMLAPRPLTARERVVVILLKMGLTPLEMARHLVVSKETVKYHRKNLYRKLGAHQPMKAVRMAEEIGLFHYLQGVV